MESIVLKILYTSIVAAISSAAVMRFFEYEELPKLVSASLVSVFLVGCFSISASAIALIWV